MPFIKQIISYIFGLSRDQKRLIALFADATTVALAGSLAVFSATKNFNHFLEIDFWTTCLLQVSFVILCFYLFGVYSTVLRYHSTKLLRDIIIGLLLSSLVPLLSRHFLFEYTISFDYSIYLFLVFIITISNRLTLLYILELSNRNDSKNIMIFGAGVAGRQILNSVNQTYEHRVLFFIENDQKLHGAKIFDVPVISLSEAYHKIKEHEIKLIILATPDLTKNQKSEILKKLNSYPIEVRDLPDFNDLVSGKVGIANLKRITVLDLLGRQTVSAKPDLMKKNLFGKKVLVTGAGGSIGSELCRQIIEYKPLKLVLLDVSEFAIYQISETLKERIGEQKLKTELISVVGSIQDGAFLESLIKEQKPDTIYHAAAYKHVPLLEFNIMAAVKNNIFGTYRLVKAAINNKVENFILISSDKAVRPTNHMGATKRFAELICQSFAQEYLQTNFAIVRFGNVLASSGSVIPKFEKQIERGGPVTVTHREVTRYFMTITEAAQLVIQAGSMSKYADIFVLDMGNPIKILDLAKQMIKLKGLQPYLLDEQLGKKGDIEIKIVGLQKGEKLYEEMFLGENIQKTSHPLIHTANEKFFTKTEMETIIQQLIEIEEQNAPQEATEILKNCSLDFNPS